MKIEQVIVILLSIVFVQAANTPERPHIIIIVADDLGFNDVGFHGSTQIPTPNIDALAYSGVILNNYYVQPICTPSRSALMTGKHPIHTGMQHNVIFDGQPWGVSPSLPLLPQYLTKFGYTAKAVGKWHLGFHKLEFTPIGRGFETHFGYFGGHADYYDHTSISGHSTIGGPHPYGLDLSEILLSQRLASLGYSTRLVGKWHLGFYHKAYTPTFRGFESHLGYWSGRIDYYDHTAFENPGYWGYDMRRNMSVAADCYGKYSTDLFTDEAVKIIENHHSSSPLFLYLAHLAVHSGNPYAPLQAPEDIVKKFSYIEDENRRKFAGMLWKLDESVGKVVEALSARGMLHNSVILFTTDNGGPAGGFNLNAASNWPLRGVKASMWEGGVRGAGFLWSPKISDPGRVSEQMLHITDWLPTLMSAAGGYTPALDSLDGEDMWRVLTQGISSPRKEFLVNYDPIMNGAALRIGDWKLLYNPQCFGKHWDTWFGPSGRNETAPQTNLKVILEMVLNSTAAKAVKAIYPQAYKNIDAIRKEAEIHCSPIPANGTASCYNASSPCLFNIKNDPCEYTNLASSHTEVLGLLKARLQDYIATAVPPRNKPFDRAANPKYWGYTWTNWKDYPTPVGMEEETVMNERQLGDPYGDVRFD